MKRKSHNIKGLFLLKEVLLTLLILIPAIALSQTVKTYSSSETVVIPAGVTSITVEAWGAGGAGGGSTNAGSLTARGGAGGGGGAYAKTTLTVTPGAPLTLVVGTGGTGVLGGKGNDGGSSTITGYENSIFAAGGNGGTANTEGGNPTGGAGGAVNNSKGTTPTPTAGGNGEKGDTGPFVASGAGGKGGNGGNGGNGINGLLTTSSGNSGNAPGGGGSGARTSQNEGNQTGGNGGNGQIKITYNCPTYALTSAATATTICGGGSGSTVTLTSTSLPAGSYIVTYSTTNPNTSNNIATMSFSGTTGTFVTKSLSATSTITVTEISSGDCSSTISSNHTATVIVGTAPTATGATMCVGGSGTLTASPCPSGTSATTVSKYASAANGGSGGRSWSNPANVYSNNDTYASVSRNAASETTTQYLQATSYGFNIPDDATIAGIKVSIKRHSENTNDNTRYVKDEDVRLIKGGTLIGDNKKGGNWATTSTVVDYGDASSLWGISWTPAHIKATNFGVALSVKIKSSADQTVKAYVDYMQITVTYTVTVNGVVNWYTASSGGALIGTGTSFNPVGVAGSGLANTNTAGTTTFYAECSTSPGCRTAVNFVINPNNSASVPSAPSNVCANTALTPITHTTTGATGIGAATGLPTGITASWNSNTITISGTPTETGTFNYSIPLTGGCGSANATGSIIVGGITSMTGGTNTTQCLGTDYSYTVSATNGVSSYQWKKSVTSGGWTNVENEGAYSGAKTAKLSITGGTPSESADYRVDVTFASGCVISSPEKRLTFLAQSPAPTVTVTQPNCNSSNGIVTVTGGQVGDTFSFDGGSTFQSDNHKSGLGSFNVVVKNAFECVSLPATTVSLEMSTATWNGNAWSKSPTNTDAIVFEGNYSSTGNLSGCSCLVKSGNVVINSAHTLTLQNAIVVTNGTFTLENNASLIQVNGVSNSGSITVKRDSAPMAMYDYTYWSSPTSGTQTLKNFAPKSNPKFLLTYDNKWMYESSSSVFKKGIGYSILAPEMTNAGPKVFSHQFVGVPNNGDIAVPVTHLSSLSSKLVGNPYPSALDADRFIAANASTITGTLYFWTHNNVKTASGYSNDYAAYNATGGIATAVASGHGNTKAPKKWIASGQGFVVSVKSSGNVVFNNSMRIVTSKKVGDDEDLNSNFYRSGSIVNSEKVLEKHRIWLNLINDENAFSQTLLGYVESATNGDDFGLDGVNFGEGPIQLYSLIDKSPYVIQARALPFSNDDEVPLGYKTLKSGNFKIAIDNMDGIFDNVDEVIIEDKLLGISQNIKAKPYNFSSESGVFNNRFVLKYGSTTLGLNDLEAVSNEVTIFSNNHRIQIQSESEPINKVFVYDMLGRQVFENTKVNSTTLSINNLDEQQVLVVKAILDNGQIVTKKIIN